MTGSARSTITGGTNKGNTTSKAIDPRLPPGGVSMITPAATDGMTFVKVGDQVTFKWNYTRYIICQVFPCTANIDCSLSVSPSYIDVVATNTVNSQTYTIAGNVSFEQTQSVVWDTGEFTQTTDLPFVIATYTLMVRYILVPSGSSVTDLPGLRCCERPDNSTKGRLSRSLPKSSIWCLHSTTLYPAERIPMRYVQCSNVAQ